MKQTIEIPEGKQAIQEIKVTQNEPHWRNITTIEDAILYVKEHLPDCKDLLTSYDSTISDSYENKIVCYRIVIAALTNNEKRYLTIGDKWYPVVQFCRPQNKRNCWGTVYIGTIESEGEMYNVIGGETNYGYSSGLGYFSESRGVSYSVLGFQSVSSKEIAEHISKYFGRLLFEVQYSGANCDWKWVEVKEITNKKK